MVVLVQRVKGARLSRLEANGSFKEVCAIGQGLAVYVGIEKTDNEKVVQACAAKTANLRIFEDESGKMMFSAREKGLSVLCIPNFTLCAQLDNGQRPSFDNAMDKVGAKRCFEVFLRCLANEMNKPPVSGVFGSNMRIAQVNDGPVNIILKSV